MSKFSSFSILMIFSIFNVLALVSILVLNIVLWQSEISTSSVIFLACIIIIGVVIAVNLVLILFSVKKQEKQSEKGTEKVIKSVAESTISKSIKLPPNLPPSKISTPPIPKTPSKSFEMNKDNSTLNIPQVPVRKKIEPKYENITVPTENEKDTSSSDSDIKRILIECQICKKVIRMPVPKKIIEESPLPVTDVTYVHGDPPHAVTAQLDKDFEVRRRRSAPVIFQDK